MKKNILSTFLKNYFIPLSEYAIIYSFIFYYLWHKISFTSIYSILIFCGIILSLFYKFEGGIASSILLLTGILKKQEYNILNFTVEDYTLIFCGITAILITGYAKSTLSKSVSVLKDGNEMLLKRKDQLLSEIISVDLSYKKFMEDIYFKNVEPAYLYFELRKGAMNIENVVEFSAKLFSILNRYLFVESGAMYEKNENGLKSIFHYGVSSLPDEFAENSLPEWNEIITTEEKVLFSRIPQKHGLLMIIPIFSQWANGLKYVFIIEKIRFVMLNPNTYTNLRVVSLMIKLIFEQKLFNKDILKFSIFKGVMVYNEKISPQILKRRIDFFNNSNIPYKVLCVSNIDTDHNTLEKIIKNVELKTRIFDEKFLIKDSLYFIFPFAETAQPIIWNIQEIEGLESIKKVEDNELKKLLFMAD